LPNYTVLLRRRPIPNLLFCTNGSKSDLHAGCSCCLG
jgi:hypothetical protein